MNRGRLVAAAALGLCLAAAVPLTQPASAAEREPMVVGFGDSVPAGGHCNCASFLQQYADRVGAATGETPAVDNLAVDGSTSSDLVEQMADPDAREAVEQATVVIVMIGANDYRAAFQAVGAGADPSRFAPVAAQVRANTANVIATVRSLNPDAQIVIADYWAAMEDGAVARRDYSPAQLTAARQATDSVNEALWSATSNAGAGWVSTWQAFRDHGDDDTDLLMPDGDHPNAAGTTVIAEALADVLPQG